MGIPGGRISKAQELTRREKRQSRKQSRANIVNAKRNLIIEEPKKVKAPELSEAEKLRLWRLEKKKKMDEEKLKRRPPFRTYINVKHTGLSPYKNTYPASINTIRKIKKTDNVTNNSATPRKRVPNASKQISESNVQKEPVMAIRITRQTVNNGLASKKEADKVTIKPVLQPRNTRSTKKSPTITTAPNTVTVVEKKPLRMVQTSTKAVKSTVTMKKVMKTDLEVNSMNSKEIKGDSIKTANNPKKDVRRKTAQKENKENVSTVNADNKKLTAANKKSQYFTRSSTRLLSTETAVSQEVSPSELPSASPSSSRSQEPSNGATFQRTRLQEETIKLLALRDKWLNKERQDRQLPENIRDEILSVTGLTTLLVTSKFEQFKSLIDDFSLQMNNADGPQRIVYDDLDGFWEMMYIQVEQLYNKYENLERLMSNNWQEQKLRPNSNDKAKKKIIKTPLPRKSGRSRFQDFLNKKKENENKQVENKTSENVTTLEDLVAAVNQEDSDDAMDLSSLKSCLATPKAVKNLLTARKSRRSSMSIIMSMSGVGKFDISGAALCPSPKVEKKVMFADID